VLVLSSQETEIIQEITFFQYEVYLDSIGERHPGVGNSKFKLHGLTSLWESSSKSKSIFLTSVLDLAIMSSAIPEYREVKNPLSGIRLLLHGQVWFQRASLRR
jgi:hypothetical protein